MLPLMFWLLCGCTPDTHGPTPAPVLPRVGTAPSASAAAGDKSALPGGNGASYEVIIASAEADRVAARDACDSKVKAERPACTEAADAAYDQAKSAADNAHNAAP
jgi:hypothetical protein